jgi:hypothetical protein
VLEDAKVPHVRLHDARHTAAPVMHLNAVPIAVIAAVLGHTDASFTQRVYLRTQSHRRGSAGNRVVRAGIGEADSDGEISLASCGGREPRERDPKLPLLPDAPNGSAIECSGGLVEHIGRLRAEMWHKKARCAGRRQSARVRQGFPLRSEVQRCNRYSTWK